MLARLIISVVIAVVATIVLDFVGALNHTIDVLIGLALGLIYFANAR